MKILVTGCNGQVGWELEATLQALGDVVAVSRQQCDLTDADSIRHCIERHAPDVLVNAAAYTAVDKAESEQALAFAINAEASLIMAEAMKKRAGLLLHYSTDYVFDGSKQGKYELSDPVSPVNLYGESKLAGENYLREIDGDYLIFRTSWVYASRAHNFMKTILRLASEREELNIVADQYGAPTWARLIAQTTAHALWQSWQEKMAGQFTSGTYHLTSSGRTSWHGFAEAIVEIARELEIEKLKVQQIHGIPTSDYPTPAARPVNSSLDLSALEQKFNVQMPDWKESLKLCMRELV